MPDFYFEVVCTLGKKIHITKDYWNFLITVKHATMEGKEELVKSTLKEPDEIRNSNKDGEVFLYYKRFGARINVVVCKHLNGDGFIITAYMTDRIKIGNLVWKRQT